MYIYLAAVVLSLVAIYLTYSSKKKACAKFSIPLGVAVFFIVIQVGMVFDRREEGRVRFLAEVESREKLGSVLGEYMHKESNDISLIRESAKEILITPLDVLGMAVLATGGRYRDVEESLIKKYYVYTWLSSGYKKHDVYFRGDAFQRRKIMKDTEGMQWLAYQRNNGSRYYKASIEISFYSYDFEKQAFKVRFHSASGYPHPPSIDRYQGSGLSEKDVEFINKHSAEYQVVKFRPVPLILFGDGRYKKDGAIRHGSSIFSTTFPEVHEPMLYVPEEFAQNVDAELFTIFATAYFDVKDMSTFNYNEMLYLQCDFMDVFTDESRAEVFKTVSCDSLNRRVMPRKRVR